MPLKSLIRLFILVPLLVPLLVPAAGKPDLSVSQLQLSRGVAHLGEQVTAVATIKNSSRIGTRNVAVRFFLGEQPIGQDYLITLQPRAEVEVRTDFAAKPQGKFEFTVHVDPDNVVPETNEKNNVMGRTLGILSLPSMISSSILAGTTSEPEPAMRAPAGDITVTELAVTTEAPAVGRTVSLRATLQYDGDDVLAAVPVRFTIDGTAITPDARVEIAAGGTGTATASFIPSRGGVHDIAVIIDPDETVPETIRDNNRRVRTIEVAAVTPKPAPAPSADTAAAAPRADSKIKVMAPKVLPNLVCAVETIEGAYYFDGNSVNIKVSNTDDTGRASPSMLGIRRLQTDNSVTPEWLAKTPVQALAAGESTVIKLAWPQQTGAIDKDARYVAVIDADNDVDEGTAGENDNRSTDFRLVPLEHASEIQKSRIVVTAPSGATPVTAGTAHTIRWNHRGEIGGRVNIDLLDSAGKRRRIVSGVSNSGRYDWGVGTSLAGRWRIVVSSADNTVQGRSEPFQIQSGPPPTLVFTQPNRTQALAAGTRVDINWTSNNSPLMPSRLDLWLISADKDAAPLSLLIGSANPRHGRYQWSIPDTPLLFGQYRLSATDDRGKTYGKSDAFNVSPKFAYRLTPERTVPGAKTLRTNLAIIEAGFRGNHLEYRVRNMGPDDMPAYILAGVRFRSYFVARQPIRNEGDYAICDFTLAGHFGVGAERRITPGRDPDCEFGLLSEDEAFEFAIMRVEIPSLIDINVLDEDLRNNSRKFRYPR